MHVPYFGLDIQNTLLIQQLLSRVEAVLKRGDFVLGYEVEAFEQSFAAKCGSRFAVGVNSGTDALILTMKSLGIGQGDEVLTVPNSYFATAASIALVGAKPVFVDVGADQNIDPALIAERLTPSTKAIIPVHWTGRPARMDALVKIAEQADLFIIEDCSQAVNARFRGRHVGNFGIAGCFSLHPIKNLGGCGDGGVIVTNDEKLYEDLKIARNHGKLGYGECLYWSHNSRLDTLQAALLNVKLGYLDGWTERRREIARMYCEHLADLPLHLPSREENEYCVYFTFMIQVSQRDSLRQFLSQQGIETMVHYPTPLHLQPAARDLGYQMGDFPMAERESQTVLSIPIFPELTEAQISYVIKMIHKFFDVRKEVLDR